MSDSLLNRRGRHGGEVLRIRCDTNVNLLIIISRKHAEIKKKSD